MILYDSTGKPHVIRPAYPEPRELPVALYRVQGFSVALEDRPEGIVATVVDVPGVTATADTRSEVLNLIREQLAPCGKPHALDEVGHDGE